MTKHRLLLAAAVLGFITAAAAAGAKCDEESDLIGSPWKPGSPYYTQEVAWRAYGMITKVNAYTDAATGCLVGVKATYGWEAINARRLGVEKAGNENLPSMDLKLQKGEVFNRLQYKADSCITYFSLQTNQGRNLTVGDINSSGELRTSQPQWADGFLAYFKGYTDVPNTSANAGRIEQLQLVWGSKTCKQKSKGSSTKAVQSTDPAAAAASATAAQEMKAAYQSGPASDAASPGDAAFEQGSGVTGSTDGGPGYADGTAAVDGTMDAVLLVTPGSPDGVTSDTGDEDTQVAVQITGQETLSQLPDYDLNEYSETLDTDSTAALTQAMGAAAAQQPTTAAAAAAPLFNTAGAAASSTPVSGSTTISSSTDGSASPFFAGPLPLRKPSADIPTSSTVVNTTTIITTTTSQQKPVDGTTEYTTHTTTTTLSATTAVCKPTTACIDGKCATSSCALNGLGKDVATMLCFGTNLVPNPLLDLTTGNPCVNLACKLDQPNCTTTEFGMTGFCTGKVVAMGMNAKLHTSGKAFLGYPCIEHRGPMLDLMPIGDYTARGTYVAKAWKVCDCINGFGLKDGSVSFNIPGGGSVTFSGSKFPTIPQFPFLNRPLVNMSLPDVVAQWVAANLADAPVPKVEVNNSVAIQLRKIIPNFTLPSIVIPQMSVPLLKLPGDFDLPVFELPFQNKTIQRVITVLPDMTSLPTLITPTEPSHIVTVKVPQLHLPQVTTDVLRMWADSLGVPIMPKLPPVFNMSFSDVLTQWVVANQFSLPVRKVTLPDMSMDTLHKLIPNFQGPSLVVLNTSVPLLKLPAAFPFPVVSIPSDAGTISALDQFLPHLTSLPALVAPLSGKKVLAALPNLNLQNITIPNIDAVAVAAGAAPPKWFNLPKLNFTLPTPQLPRVPDVNFTLPGLTLPSITLAPPKLNLSLPLPNLSHVTGALQGLQSATNLSVLPELIGAWKEQYLSNPFDFDFAGFKQMVTSNQQVQPDLPQGFEVSFEVPNVMAQWIAGLVKGAQVPRLEVPGEVLRKLQSLVPELPTQPSLVIMNVSSPYYSMEAINSLGVPTVVVPDNILSKVTSMLPDLTLVPQFLVPQEQISSLQVNLPAVSLESLAAPSFLQTVSQMMAGLQSKAGGLTPQDQVAVNVAPAAATPAAATASTYGGSSSSSSGGMMPVIGYTGLSASPTVTVVQPEPMPVDSQAAMYNQPGFAAVQPLQPSAVNPAAATAGGAVSTAAQPANLGSVTVAPYDDSLIQDYDASMEAEPVLVVTADAANDQPGYNSPTWDDGSGDDVVTDFYPADLDYDEPESGSIYSNGATNTQPPQGFREDEEGALLIEGFGPETAFMNPKDFYALDKETQKKFKAMFNL